MKILDREAAEAELLKLLAEERRHQLKTDFYSFCEFRRPKMYTPKHTYLKMVANTLQDFMENKILKDDGTPYDKLMFLAPPRHGKTLTIENLCQWVLGNWPDTGIITASYNETLSSRLAKNVRDAIQEIKVTPDKMVYADIFPEVKIKLGDGSMRLWSLKGRHFSFLATSPGGTMTGIGAQLLIVDDLIKNHLEAYNERVLEEHWDWYNNTTESRLEAGAKQIIINTRWATKDISGRCLERDPGDWHVIKLPALNESTGMMLADDILSRETFEKRRKSGDEQIINANYQQEPFDSNDKLYPKFKTYPYEATPKRGKIEAYFDTADEGKDFLSGAVYWVYENAAYILDILYTQDSMEITEPKSAAMIVDNRCEKAYIESNNGGRAFARKVEEIMRRDLEYSACQVEWFHQSENKQARILSNATSVVNSVFFPVGWENRWPQFYAHVKDLSRMSKWLFDDAPDMLTGIVEKSLTAARVIISESDRAEIGARYG